MTRMSPGWLEWRKQFMFSDDKKIPAPTQHAILKATEHKKSYTNGHIRCVACNKWINPNDPEEAKEFVYGKNGKRIHSVRYCPIQSAYVSVFSTTPKFSRTRSRKWRNALKRY